MRFAYKFKLIVHAGIRGVQNIRVIKKPEEAQETNIRLNNYLSFSPDKVRNN